MSQMLVRIDDEIDKALTYIYNNDERLSMSEFFVLSIIARGIYQQWKPNHEAMLKLRKEAEVARKTDFALKRLCGEDK